MMLASVSEPTSVIVPSRHATREGDGMNAIPFAPTSNRRYQQIYSASEFAQGGAIDAVRFRRDRNHEPFEATTLDVQISLSHAATTVATASEVFSENIGTGNVVVYSGPLSLSSSGSGTPNPFDVVIDVANVFEYDPEVGDLLLDIRVLGGSLSHGALDASIIPPTTIRIFGTINATVGSTGINGDRTPYGLVTQFDLVPPTASVDGRTRAADDEGLKNPGQLDPLRPASSTSIRDHAHLHAPLRILELAIPRPQSAHATHPPDLGV